MEIPLTEYVNRSCIGYAQILLLTSDLPLNAIALQCGITDMQYFSRMFKRITGSRLCRHCKNGKDPVTGILAGGNQDART